MSHDWTILYRPGPVKTCGPDFASLFVAHMELDLEFATSSWKIVWRYFV